MNKPLLFLTLIIALLASCAEQSPAPESLEEAPAPQFWSFDIKEYSDETYPDNPDIGYKASDYQDDLFSTGKLSNLNGYTAQLCFNTIHGDSICFHDFQLGEYIPTAPDHIVRDSALQMISLINQEWNRNQVRFSPESFKTSLPGIVRVDVARNCLNACLWEVALYKSENEKTVPYAHGWFDFPSDLYGNLIEGKNEIQYSDVRESLEQWQDPGRLAVDLEKLRQVKGSKPIQVRDLSDSMYPLTGARKKKFKEIIVPASFDNMRQLQSDSTTFATFTPPGLYDRTDPRHTELGRFVELSDAKWFKTETLGKEYSELSLTFQDGERTTHLLFGGLTADQFATSSPSDPNGQWRTSMGIGNHPFYETTEDHEALPSKTNPYYGLLLDHNGRWLDSHDVGIDGPIFHWDDERQNVLHLWLLSFERHALVGHYEIEFVGGI